MPGNERCDDSGGVLVVDSATELDASAADLVADETRRAVERRRDPFSASSEARSAERILDDRRHGIRTA